jgi:TolA-binding protein
MTRIFTFSLIVLAMLAIVSCKPSRDKLAGSITEMEKRMFASNAVTLDKQKADSLIAMFDDFVNRFPQDTLAATYTFLAAQVEMNMNNGPKAMEYFDRFLKQYPTNRKAPMAMFFQAFVQENLMHNLDKAKEIYLNFIEKYPTNEFADDAKMAVQNLGKSPEQLVREFEEKQKK